ncbi:Putative ATP /GTP binding protein [hydrothermal vent metagenome]|uniref:Putative ATP /GTP binding protein n=1 Tax=hydrothermal vent metagenome TaxID=652676 RepID=A0A1W1EFI1_9ZZZZ
MSNPNIFNLIVEEYKDKYFEKNRQYEKTLLGDVKKIKDELMSSKFSPSVELERILNKQIKRVVYPIELAIVGQFSSGKSTFLNALLSKDVLPTGITPVTSKVIYINYGESHKLRVTYKSGAHEYHPIENISQFSDQRLRSDDDIKYLSVYAPLDILKDMSFVDTPGLNSQSQEDTYSTKKVFQDVGGIIWLTLIDNAGKRSEEEILENYMSSFKTKSLCLLNQKDKFTQEQIETTTKYVEDKFDNYFSKVIPISAKMALNARELEPTTLVDAAIETLIKDFRKGVHNNPSCNTLKFFENDFTQFKNELKKIKDMDSSSIDRDIEESNINDVITYIKNNIQPNATDMKSFRIKNDLKNICDILMNSYFTMAGVYDAIDKVLNIEGENYLKSLDKIDFQYSSDLSQIHSNILNIFQSTSQDIYSNITSVKKEDFKESKSSFLKQEKIEKYYYDTFIINKNIVLNKLFYNDEIIEKSIKAVMRRLDSFEVNVNDSFEKVYNDLQASVIVWQQKYLLLSKNREISSDLEFSKVKRFASKVHENILISFYAASMKNIEVLNKKSAYLHGALSYNFMQTVQVTIAEIEENILESEEIAKKDPSKYSIYKPSQEDILQKLKMNFDFEKLDDFMISKNNYLHRVVKVAKKEFSELLEEKLNFIAKEKEPFLKKAVDIEEIKDSIVL